MPTLIVFIDKNPPFEVEVDPPVEGKPSTSITQFPRWRCFIWHLFVDFRDSRVHDMLHRREYFSERETMPLSISMLKW